MLVRFVDVGLDGTGVQIVNGLALETSEQQHQPDKQEMQDASAFHDVITVILLGFTKQTSVVLCDAVTLFETNYRIRANLQRSAGPVAIGIEHAYDSFGRYGGEPSGARRREF